MSPAQPGSASAPPPPSDLDPTQFVQQPGKLLRITSMIRGLLEEVRQSPLDESARTRVREVYESSRSELKDILSEDLQRELEALASPLAESPTDAEIRVAQAQLFGWLEGLLHGIQAALMAQQLEAQAQLEQRRRPALPGSGQGEGGKPPPGGQYL